MTSWFARQLLGANMRLRGLSFLLDESNPSVGSMS